jgi:hypothetical protein
LFIPKKRYSHPYSNRTLFWHSLAPHSASSLVMVVKQPSPPPLSSVARLTSARRRRRWSAVMSTARAFEGSTTAAPHAGQVTESERAPRDAGEEPMMPYSGALAVPQAFPTGLSTACVRLPFAPRPRLVILPPHLVSVLLDLSLSMSLLRALMPPR